MIGNTYDTKEMKVSHVRKVWREVREAYPAGGRVVNISDWVEAGKKVIPSGTLAKIAQNANGGKEVTCYLPTALPSEEETTGYEEYGYTKNDIPLTDENTVGTATVVYDGEIYKYMLPEEVQPVGKKLVPGVKQVF